MVKKCTYCGRGIKSKDPNKQEHKICKMLREFSDGRNLTENGGYYMSYVPDEKQDIFPNLSPNSRGYVYTHELVARLILKRDLIAQGEDDSEIVDHVKGNTSKLDFSPKNLRVMNLKKHIHTHKFHGGEEREYEDK